MVNEEMINGLFPRYRAQLLTTRRAAEQRYYERVPVLCLGTRAVVSMGDAIHSPAFHSI